MYEHITEIQMRSDYALWAAKMDYRWLRRGQGVTPTDLIIEFATAHGTTIKALRSRKRKRPLVHRRQECMAMLRENTDLSLPAIGRLFNRDHTTVKHGIAAVEKRASR